MSLGIKRWIAGGPPGPSWSDVSAWARQQGHGFKRARDDEGFVVDGTFGDHSWRLEWGPPQRTYIDGHELRIRMAMKLSSNLQLLLLTRALMETLERETFDRYTKSNQTLIDVSTPEEMRWLAMFPKIPPADLPKELRQRFALVASDANVGLQWIDPAFTQQLCVVASRLLDHEPPFVVLLPATSIIHAAFSVSRRAWSIMQRASAMRSCVTVCAATGLPKATRRLARLHISSSERSARPIRRMQWWMRPGPSRPWAISKPRPSPRSMLPAGTRTSSKRISAWPFGASS